MNLKRDSIFLVHFGSLVEESLSRLRSELILHDFIFGHLNTT